jgi:hypothetical protein
MKEWQANCKKAGKEVSVRDLKKALFEIDICKKLLPK